MFGAAADAKNLQLPAMSTNCFRGMFENIQAVQVGRCGTLSVVLRLSQLLHTIPFCGQRNALLFPRCSIEAVFDNMGASACQVKDDMLRAVSKPQLTVRLWPCVIARYSNAWSPDEDAIYPIAQPVPIELQC